MTRSQLCCGALIASVLSVVVGGQSGPRSIAGAASSARNCVSGDAANVHGIGWVPAGATYTITFDSEIAVATAVARVDLVGSQSTIAFGTPDLRFTTSTPGSMVLYVTGRGQAGCYRYKVEIQQPAATVAPASASRISSAMERALPASLPIRTMAITGAPSSAKHCVTGTAAKIHGIGWVEEGSSVRITFDSDFDPVAGVTLVNFAPERGTYLVDDNGGGSQQPSLFFTASQSGTLALHVASVGGRAGCYRYGVEITAPTSTAPPTIAELAPSLALEINTSLEAALRADLATASLESNRPATFFASLLHVLLPTVYAQTGIVGNCRSGGTVRISSGYSKPGGGRVVFNSGQVTYTDCRYPFRTRFVTFSGTLRAGGTWTATAAANPVTLQGSLNVIGVGDGIGTPIDCYSLSTQFGCQGYVGGITTGPPTTAPPPNPPPPPPGCFVNGVFVSPCPPAPPPGSTPNPTINLTGTWNAGSVTLNQMGTQIMGTTRRPSYFASDYLIVENVITGSITADNAVSLTQRLSWTQRGVGNNLAVTEVTQWSLRATRIDAGSYGTLLMMSGTYARTHTITCSADRLGCSPNESSTVNTSGNGEWERD